MSFSHANFSTPTVTLDLTYDALSNRTTVDYPKCTATAFRVMAAYVGWFASEGAQGERLLAMLRLLGLFDRPANAACLAALRQPPVIAGLTKPLAELSPTQ